jgi:enamine deaminase RidA (YjgF/YER057c/UK114 family)
MTSATSAPPLDVLGATELPTGDVSHATAVRAGGFLFATGATMLDHPSERVTPAGGRVPLPGLAHARAVLDGLLASVGGAPERTLRIDQFYPAGASIDDYQAARRATLGGHIPPSTSIIVDELLPAGAHCDVSLIAALPDDEREPERLSPAGVDVPAWAGFAPLIRYGDWVFVAGQMADAPEGGLDARLAGAKHHNWGTRPVTRQTEIVINDRLTAALEGAGASFDGLVKAQAYVADAADVPYFLEVWERLVGLDRCALTVVPGTGFNVVGGAVEVNAIAVTDAAREGREVVDVPGHPGYGAAGVRFGELLFASGLVAPPDPERSERAATLRHLGGAAEEMTAIAAELDRICAAAGTSRDRTVRLQTFHGDLAGFLPMLGAWRRDLGEGPVPFSAIGTQAPPVPGATVTLDACVHAPARPGAGG